MAVVPSPEPARGDRAWSAAVDEAIREAERTIPPRNRGVQALVYRLGTECKRRGRTWLDVSRGQLVCWLGFKGGRYPAGSPQSRASEEAVRRLVRRAELVGAVRTARSTGRRPLRIAVVQVLHHLGDVQVSP
jgi:hypothetical protein